MLLTGRSRGRPCLREPGSGFHSAWDDIEVYVWGMDRAEVVLRGSSHTGL